MIGFLSGIVKSVKSNSAVILVNGVGYSVTVPNNLTLRTGQPADLYIHTHVREDALSLFGFPNEDSLSLFDLLITVSGVGPKSALAIISTGPTDSIQKAIQAGNLSFFTSVSGIGKKGAQKIILELKPKLSGTSADMKMLEGESELGQALTQLGFAKSEIQPAIASIDPSLAISEQIKIALKSLRK